MSSARIISCGSTCSRAHSVIAVSTKAGHRAVTWIPSPPSSFCVAWLKPTSPAFVAEYTESQPSPDLPAIDAVLTMSAFPCSAPASRRSGVASRVAMIAARRFTPSCMSRCFVTTSPTVCPIPTPALFTSTSSRPNRLRCAAIMPTISSSFATFAPRE